MSRWHAWYSAKSEEKSKQSDIHIETPTYVDDMGEPVQVTFVQRERDLDFYSTWDDLQYIGVVTKKTENDTHR